MTRISSIPILAFKLRLGLPARVALLGATCLAEKILLDGFADNDRIPAAHGFDVMLRAVQHWGFRWSVVFAIALAAFAYVRGGEKQAAVEELFERCKVKAGWVAAHVVLVTALIPLNYWLYGDGAAPIPIRAVALLWAVCAGVATLAAVLALAPWRLWLAAWRVLGIIRWYAGIAAVLGVGSMQSSQRLWDLAAGVTFDVVAAILTPVIPSLTTDAATRIIGTDRFSIEVSPVCSGLEGMGLILVFIVAWLAYFRREYIFPRALVLVPVALALMFAFNSLRIAALMLIGYAGFPDVASYGFHSQAGWIAFNVAACLIVYFSRRIGWLNRSVARSPTAAPTHNMTAPFLMPLLAVLAAGMVSHALSSRFETTYPLRLIAALAVLAAYRRPLRTLDWRFSWRAPAVGIAVYVLWIIAARFIVLPEAMPAPLEEFPGAIRDGWIACRAVAAILTVPLVEELAYRGYLMRRLVSSHFESVHLASVRWPALCVTSIVFGMAHGAFWLPAIAAGFAYGMLAIRRDGIGEAVAAHATTNALLAVTVVAANQWQFW